jgi:hypothetical protein
MPKKLKTHVASFKFKVVLESFTSNNVAETARKYSLNANQLSTWRGYFLEHGIACLRPMQPSADRNWRNRSPRWNSCWAKRNWRSSS